MVQVDVFWAWGLGASLAMAAGPQLQKTASPLDSRYFSQTLLFLALVWAPTGMYLLLRHPSWETMQVAESFMALPPLLVLAFGITNVSQGALGFAVGAWLIRRRRARATHLNWMVGYLGMFVVLVHGWDGLGYDRFLYDRGAWPGAPAWTPGAGATPSTLLQALLGFLGSGVNRSLLACGLFLLPAYFFLMVRWAQAGQREAGSIAPSPARLIATLLGTVFGVCLGVAVLASVVVRGVARWWPLDLGIGPDAAGLLGLVSAFALGLAVLWWTLHSGWGPAARLLAPWPGSAPARRLTGGSGGDGGHDAWGGRRGGFELGK
ncbi:hypothetical protein [Caldimonas brevitalea]|uniref:Uncharacterized protein n=1 Tax=Caldimonas brevitalea TaxID=413882 RepID=A0A0G3BX51_9BURK|nr:hypothetical protein [Caldimonas brevitalea]AKJ31115.1 hypothetical protein AAW51_4424 [Caldimonas brevitalea]